MNLLFRLIWLCFKRLINPAPISAFDSCESYFRVNPLDLDVNLHMNNGRYLSIMDLGRMDLMFRAKLFAPLFRRGYYPVVVSQSIRFRRSLELGQRFRVVTQIDSWTESDFYIRQIFWRGEELVAEGYIKGRFRQRGRKGSVGNSEIFGLAEIQAPQLPLSRAARALDEIEGELRGLSRDTTQTTVAKT